MAKGSKNTAKGLFGFTQSQMRAQIANLAAKPTGAVQRVSGDQAAAISTFGYGLTKSVKKNFVGARAAAQEQAVIQTAGEKVLKEGTKTIADIALIFKQSDKQQAAAFARAKALQMQEQTAASDSQTAAFQQQLFMAELQREWAIEDEKRAQRAAMKAASGEAQSMAAGMMAQAPMVSSAAADAYRFAVDQAGDSRNWDVSAAMTRFTEQTNFTAETPQYQLAMAQMQAMRFGGAQRFSDTMGMAMNTIYGGAPGAEKWLQPAIQAAEASSVAALAGARAAYIEANPSSYWLETQRPGAPPPDEPPEFMSLSERLAASPFGRNPLNR